MNYLTYTPPLPARIETHYTLSASQLTNIVLLQGQELISTNVTDINIDTMYVTEEGEVADRPTPPAPPSYAAGVLTSWTGLPSGATVTVVDKKFNDVLGQITANELGHAAIQFPAGEFILKVSEVFPYFSATFTITVPE